MVFGLKEEVEEELTEKIDDILVQVGEKPRFRASRIGTVGKGDKGCRPVKITVGSPVAVHQILAQSRNLRDVERFKSVFLCPDRSTEERVVRRKLVIDLKKIAAEQPGQQHFIKDGKVCSVEKTDI